MKLFILLSLWAFLSNCQSELFDLVLLSQERGGACLDGSPPGFYIHQGAGVNKNKFMIYFDSGGFCGAPTLNETLQSCYQRSSSSLGTTKNYKPQKNYNNYGLLSPLKEKNPVFYDWTKLFVIYCDGSEYVGHRQNPIPYKDKSLYFRGSKNVMELFRHLDEKYDFYNGDTIVMTGVSAGGMATYQWSNYLVENTKKAKVYAMPDSGFFITDYYSEIAQQKIIRVRGSNLFNLINDKDSMPQPIRQCLEKPNLDLIDCFNSGNYFEFLKAPTFIIESHYDEFSVSNILAVSCLKNTKPPYSLQNCPDNVRKIIEDYRLASLQYIRAMKGNRTDVGIWSPACVQHGFSDEDSFFDARYKVKGLTLAEAVQKFLHNPSNAPWLMDEEPWPSNAGCSGMAQLRFQ